MDFFGIRSLPYLTRRNYYFEFKHLMLWGMLASLIEGNAAAIILVKTFGGSDYLVAAASATPIGALVFSSIWGTLCVGRPKLRLTTIFAALCTLCVATVCLTPMTTGGGVLFVVQMAAAQIFLSGVVTVRSALWKHNYPAECRGMIAARLQGVRLFIGVCFLFSVSTLFDYDADLYRYLYPTTAVFGLLAIVILRNMHVRHERSELARQQDPNDREAARAVTVRQAFSPVFLFRGIVDVLRRNPRFARYMLVQMAFGMSVQLTLPVLVQIVSRTADRYIVTALLIDIIPKLLMFASLRRWGPFFDRVGVNRFRVFTGLCASLAILFGMIATCMIVYADSPESHMVTIALVLFGLRGVFHGMHQGGGSLAWNLGHLHYAERHDAEQYMAVHQTFTGLRGLITPFLGMALWQCISWGVFAVSLALCLTAVYGFHRLAESETPGRKPV